MNTLIALFFALAPTHAADMMDLQQLATASDHVIAGEVLTQHVESTPTGVYTYVTVLVDETLRGRHQPVVDVRVPGGKFGDLDVEVPGAPSFIVGTDVMLFLLGNHVVGLGDGAFILDGGRVWRPLQGERFLNPATLSDTLDTGLLDTHFQSWTVADVRQALRQPR